jgi:hypothetical protein
MGMREDWMMTKQMRPRIYHQGPGKVSLVKKSDSVAEEKDLRLHSGAEQLHRAGNIP